MNILRYFLLPFSLLYGLVLSVRNMLFHYNVLKTVKLDVPIVSVGNLSVGGTGKTPHVKWLVEQFISTKKCAIVLRGYGRKTKGYVRVNIEHLPQQVGDEAVLYKHYFGVDVEVVVCEDRVAGVQALLKECPDIKLIFLDDAYQHRKIQRDVNILLTDYLHPFWRDGVLPFGRLREFSIGKRRADIIIVTKCPVEISGKDKLNIERFIKPKHEQLVAFSSLQYDSFAPLFDHKWQNPSDLLLVTGIANPDPLELELMKQFKVRHLRFNDHYDFSAKDIQRIHDLFDTFVKEGKAIVTTEKDATRLIDKIKQMNAMHYPWFYQSISLKVDGEKQIIEAIKKIC